MRRFLTLSLLLACGLAFADESIRVCYNYGCASEATARFSEPQLRTLAKKLRATRSAAEERTALANAMGQLYGWAGNQTPIIADKGGNTADEAMDGAMDCIDHSTTTTRFLKMLESRRLLKYHQVEDVTRRRRFIMFEHFSAVIKELPHPLARKQGEGGMLETSTEAESHRYVVDSWFVNNGKPAVVLPLEDWMDGAGSEARQGS